MAADGEFRYLPDRLPSRQGEKLFQQAFSRDLLGSSIVIVSRRLQEDGLTDTDRGFIENTLKPNLKSIADRYGGVALESEATEANSANTGESKPPDSKPGDSAQAKSSPPTIPNPTD